MATVDCSIGEDELATVGIATIVFDGLSAGRIALEGSSFLGDLAQEGFPRLDSGKMMVVESETQLKGETLGEAFPGVAMGLVDLAVKVGGRVGPSSSSHESLSGKVGAGRRK